MIILTRQHRSDLVVLALDIQDYLDLELGLSNKDYHYILTEEGLKLTCVNSKHETLIGLKFGQ